MMAAIMSSCFGGSILADEADHGLNDALAAEAQALAPAFIVTTGPAPTAAERINVGTWGPVISWTPHIPVTAATLPDGRLLTFASNQRTTFPVGAEFTYAAVWNPATGVFTEINNTRHDMFCGGTAMLPDGRLLINGGRNTTRLSSIFDWRTSQWAALPNMNDGRWYNTSVALTNGEVFTVTGDGGTNTAERWNSSTGWSRLTGINWSTVVSQAGYVTRWHPLVVVAPDGRLFHGGPTDRMNWLTASGTGSLTYSGITVPGAHYPKEGCFAVYDEGRILVAGGSANTTPNPNDSSTGTSTNLAFTIDIRGATPVVAQTASMKYVRQFVNSVILPTGEVMAIGGNTSGLKFNDTGSILSPEIWNPATGQWREVTDMSVPRNYHSVALLLPDGRVWSGGGGLSGNSADHRDAQIYTPGVLYAPDGSLATRPVITQAPSYISTSTVFTVRATPGLQKFSFIKMSAQTHSMNTDLRYLSLPFTETSPGVYTVRAHANLNVMTPGYWMLFGVGAGGVYSESKVIQVDPSTTVSVASPGNQIHSVNSSVIVATYGVAPGGGGVTYSASGLPPGLNIDPTSGLISGTPTTAGTYSSARVTVTDGITSASTTFSWTITVPTLNSSFANFNGASSSFQLNGNASFQSGVLRLTPNTANQGGTAFLTSQIPVSEGTSFNTRFTFRMAGTADGADGMTFIIQGDRVNALGSQGGGLGYEGILESVAVELDTYAAGGELNANHVGVLTNGVVSNHLGVAAAPFDLENGSTHTLWVDYDGPADRLSVYLAQGVSTTKPATPLIVVNALKLHDLVGANAWLGFGGATGGSSNTHEVLAWDLSVNAFAPPSAPVVTTPGARSSVVGMPASLAIQATDANQDVLAYSASGLPPGLSIQPSTGLISGTPTTLGTYNATVTVNDGNSAPVAVQFTWVVQNTLVVQAPATAAAPTGSTITFSASSSGGANPRYRWNFGDGSPTTEYSPTMAVSHVFPGPGRYLVTLTATDDTGAMVTTTFYQVVHAPLTALKPAVSSGLLYEDRPGGNDRVWVVNPDTDSVTVFDAVTRQKLAETTVGTGPRTIAQAPDGRVWVANVESSTVSILNNSSFAVAGTLSLPRGSRPFGLAFDPAGTAAYVVLEGTGMLLKLHPGTGAQLGSVNVGLNARHVSVTADSNRILVSRFITPPLPGENTATPATAGRGGEVLVVNAANLTASSPVILAHSELEDTPTSARGIPNYLGAAAISPDGLSAWVPSKQDNIKRGALRNGVGLNHDQSLRAIASRIQLATLTEDLPGRVDFDNAGMPSAAVFDPWGGYLFVALESSRAVAVVDAWNQEVITRFDVGLAPQALAMSPDGRTLFVQNFMDRTVSVHDVSGLLQGGTVVPTTLAVLNSVATEKLPATVLKGKQLFYDARDSRLALQEYISCAACHNDGGHDGRVWDFTGSGEGLRNTITLRGHGLHGALHWTGNFDEVHDFEGQIRAFAGGTGLMSDAQFNTGTRSQPLGDAKAGLSTDLDALAAYVTSLTGESRSPHRNADGSLTAPGSFGEKVFRQQNCASCHSGTSFTNSALNVFSNVGTLTAASGKRLGQTLTGLDVPTLRGVWATAPYLHDGSAATLAEAITRHQGLSLSTAEIEGLVAFLQQIDDAPLTAPPPVTVTLSSLATGPVSDPFEVSVAFSHPVSSFTLQDITVTGGTAGNLTGEGRNYTFIVTPTAAVSINLPAGAAGDAEGITNLASNTLAYTYTAPTNTPALAGQDIGIAFLPGGTVYDTATGLYTLTATGEDIFFTNDGFHFAQITLNGDGEIRARVRGLNNTNPWAKAGVMVRESLATGSRHATMFITPPGAGNGFGMVWRPTTNAATAYAGGPALNTAPNNWVRLVRQGAIITGYASADGVTWIPVQSVTLSGLPTAVSVGLAATAADTSVTTTATFDNVQIIGAQAAVPPAVTLSTASGAETGPFSVQAQFTQPVSGLALADFVISNATASNLTGSGTTYSLTLTPVAAGVVTASLPAGAAQNAGGITSLASNIVSVNYTVPTPGQVTLQGQDIGTVAVAGSTTFETSGGIYTLKGAGNDIFFTADGFQYALTQLNGDGEIRARVTSQTNTNPWAKAGVMFRENLTAGSRHAMMFTTPTGAGNGFGMVWRPTANAATTYAGGPALNAAPNNWVRLVRSGSTLTTYASANGTAWTTVGVTTLSGLPSNVYVGLALTSGSSQAATATFDNVQIVGAQAVVAPDVALSAASALETGPFSVQAQFTQAVTGLATTDFVVTNGTVTSLSGSGLSYTATITPQAAGLVSVRLPAGAAQNSAGAPSNASNTVEVTYTLPGNVALQGVDVGDVLVAGSTTYNSTSGVYTLMASGADIFFTADGFHFANTQLTGDGEIRARVTSQQNLNAWAKAGVMIRETLTDGSRHVTMFTTPMGAGNGFGRVWRPTANASTNYGGGPALNTAPNNWVRLVRSGDSITAYASANGNSWTSLGTATLSGLAGTVYVGLAHTSTTPLQAASATFDNVQIVGTLGGGGSSGGSNTGSNSVKDTDMDGDDVNDLLEYALGETAGSQQSWWLTATTEGRVDAHVMHPVAVQDVTFRMEASADMVTWSPLPLAPTKIALGAGYEQLTWSGLSSLSGQNSERGIVRLRVTHSSGLSATSTPQAWQSIRRTPGTQTVGVSLVNAAIYAGFVSALSDGFRLTLRDGETLLLPETPCYLEVRDGPLAGHRFDIESATAGLVVLAPNSANNTQVLTGPLPADLAGARVTIRPHITLSQVFPKGLMQGSSTSGTADQVLMHTGTTWQTHWLLKSGGYDQWVRTDDATLGSQDARVIPPGTGVMLKTASQTGRHVITGHVRTNAFLRPLPAGHSLLALPWPLDATPNQLHFTVADGFVAAANAGAADQIQTWVADSIPGSSTYSIYWLLKTGAGGQWTPLNNAALPDVSGTLVLPADRAFFFKAQPGTQGLRFWK